MDGFWSISVYNDKGYFEKNDLNAQFWSPCGIDPACSRRRKV